MAWKDSVEPLEEYTSIDEEQELERVVPKSYSLPPSLHAKLKDEAKRRSRLAGRRVSASELLVGIVKNWEPDA